MLASKSRHAQQTFAHVYTQTRNKTKMVKAQLLEDLPNVGREGDVVYLKYGFVYNYLVPYKKARTVKPWEQLEPTATEKFLTEEQREQQAVRRRESQMERAVQRLTSKIVLVYSAADGPVLRKPMSVDDIVEAVRRRLGVELPPGYIKVADGQAADAVIPTTGRFKVPLDIRLPEGAEAALRVEVRAKPSKKGPAVTPQAATGAAAAAERADTGADAQ